MKHHIRIWIGGWIDIYCGLCQVLSLGFYRPSYDFDWIAYCIKKELKARKL